MAMSAVAFLRALASPLLTGQGRPVDYHVWGAPGT